ncbi:unnamed protein product [Protopolystoma xenopodis]|uniref:Uncharacterized protein n=1 Tax=Protopolystoma xenopodis TaxID=117903 RepID=A0A448WBR7_9PLAT|nr:unnamed protein product [Protopolystoma xenopodis]
MAPNIPVSCLDAFVKVAEHIKCPLFIAPSLQDLLCDAASQPDDPFARLQHNLLLQLSDQFEVPAFQALNSTLALTIVHIWLASIRHQIDSPHRHEGRSNPSQGLETTDMASRNPSHLERIVKAMAVPIEPLERVGANTNSSTDVEGQGLGDLFNNVGE